MARESSPQSPCRRVFMIFFVYCIVVLCGSAGASHVKWSKFNLLATAHDGDLRVWDPRVCDSCVLSAPLISAVSNTRSILSAIFPGEPGLVSLPLNSPSPIYS